MVFSSDTQYQFQLPFHSFWITFLSRSGFGSLKARQCTIFCRKTICQEASLVICLGIWWFHCTLSTPLHQYTHDTFHLHGNVVLHSPSPPILSDWLLLPNCSSNLYRDNQEFLIICSSANFIYSLEVELSGPVQFFIWCACWAFQGIGPILPSLFFTKINCF